MFSSETFYKYDVFLASSTVIEKYSHAHSAGPVINVPIVYVLSIDTRSGVHTLHNGNKIKNVI